MALVTTEIDGRKIEVERDRWAIDVAREMGIEIPSLCYHAALASYGSCRLCVVEVSKRQWTWLATACDLPIREGLTIRTNTPGVIKARKMALELLGKHKAMFTDRHQVAEDPSKGVACTIEELEAELAAMKKLDEEARVIEMKVNARHSARLDEAAG